LLYDLGILVFRDFFGVSFGDELHNVVNGIARKALAEFISELTPRLGARLDLYKDFDRFRKWGRTIIHSASSILENFILKLSL
jgi:hypothetical protein